jgi:hypothetical protein
MHNNAKFALEHLEHPEPIGTINNSAENLYANNGSGQGRVRRNNRADEREAIALTRVRANDEEMRTASLRAAAFLFCY